jgi:hypothetical protein
MAFFGFLFRKRPLADEQNTGREAFQQSMGYSPVAYNGNGGFTVLRAMRATTPAGITPGPTHKLNDPTVTGNTGYSLNQQPLSDDNGVMSGAQF